jgi:heat shock protein HtpX
MSGLWNNAKTTLLLGSLMGLCLGIGYLIGGNGGLVYAFLFGGVLNLIMFFFSDKIALATMRAQEIGPDDDPTLWQIVEQLSQRAGLPMPRVYISPAAAPNAFATGRGPRHSAVCVTAGLRQMLNDHELQGVLAHELSHVKNRDVLISTIAAIMAGALTVLTRIFVFTGGGHDDERRGNPLIAILLMILAPIAALIIQMAISRSREYEADRSGAELAGDPRGLARSLQKLESANRRIPMHVPDAQSSLFIVQPLTGSNFAKLFSTHPPTEERVARLMEMERRGY